MTTFHLDYETFSEAPFGKKKGAVGLDNYAKHPSTEVLMASWAWDHEPVQQSDDETVIRRNIQRAVNMSHKGLKKTGKPGVIFKAFNAPFERTISREVLGVDIPIEWWRCVMVHAYSLGFMGTLGDVGAQLGLPQDKQKLDAGTRLIHKFSQPAPKNHKADRYTKTNAPEEWRELCEYNRQDTVSEREVDLLLSRYPMSEREWELWSIDQRINGRGLPIEKEIVDSALSIYHAEKRHLTALLRQHTGVDNPNSRDQLLEWFQKRGLEIGSLAAEHVESWLAQPPWDEQVTPEIRRVFKLRQQSARTAGSKWEAFKRLTDWNTGRLRHQFQFNGAQRTGRWGGRGVQPHNLHRSPWDQDEKVRSMLG